MLGKADHPHRTSTSAARCQAPVLRTAWNAAVETLRRLGRVTSVRIPPSPVPSDYCCRSRVRAASRPNYNRRRPQFPEVHVTLDCIIAGAQGATWWRRFMVYRAPRLATANPPEAMCLRLRAGHWALPPPPRGGCRSGAAGGARRCGACRSEPGPANALHSAGRAVIRFCGDSRIQAKSAVLELDAERRTVASTACQSNRDLLRQRRAARHPMRGRLEL